tara:strand:- start:87 stop:695 length:609 start_codon:yes stop_codon:yes gene_type:complete
MKRTLTKTTDRVVYNCQTAWLLQATKKQWKIGKAWYKEAQKFTKYLSKKYNVDRYIVAAVLSILSPNNKWERNKQDAEAMIKAFVEGRTIDSFKVCTYNPNKVKAWGVLNGDTTLVAKSPKTHAFSMNIGRLSEKHVTVDKWHVRACLCKPKDGIVDTVETLTSTQYRRVEAITARIAEEHKLKAYEAQAIIWVTIKEKWNR